MEIRPQMITIQQSIESHQHAENANHESQTPRYYETTHSASNQSVLEDQENHWAFREKHVRERRDFYKVMTMKIEMREPKRGEAIYAIEYQKRYAQRGEELVLHLGFRSTQKRVVTTPSFVVSC